jgi:hypothetical protein
MPGLSNIFGSDDSSSSSDSNANGGIMGDVESTLGLDANSSQTYDSTDEDGNSSSSTNENGLSLDTGTDGLLGAVGHLTDSSDESTS